MEVEVLVNESGKIIAAVERKAAKLSGAKEVSIQAILHARQGQTRHIVTMPPELASLSLRAIVRSCRFAQDADGPRLEKRNA